MVRRVIQLVYREVRGLHQAAYVLGLFAFGSQLLALVRDRMLAHQFGAGAELDLYYAAFKLPDLLYVLFASTLSVYVLIPFVSTKQHHEDGEGARNLLSQIFSLFLLAYTVLALVLLVSAPWYVPKLFPGLATDAKTLVLLMQILLLQPLFLGVSSLFGVVTQLGHRFVLYAISPLVYNLGIIFGISVLYPIMGLTGLAYGVVLGAFCHMLVQYPLVKGSALAFSFTRHLSWQTILAVLKVSIPRAATLAMQQIVLLVFVSIASVMTVGSVAVFQFAFNLQSVPLAIIGASYSIAAFPLLADYFASNRLDEFRSHIISALRHIIFWSVPAIGLIIVLRAQMVRVVLGSGSFDWSDTKLTAAVLALLSISLVAQAINLLLIRVFYAGWFTKIPFIMTFISSVSAVALAYVLYSSYISAGTTITWLDQFMRLDGVEGAEVMVLAIAFSAAVFLQLVLLLASAASKFKLPMSWLGEHLLRSSTAAVVGGVAAYATLNFLVSGINQDTFVGIFIQGLFGGIMGIIGIVLTYFALQTPELTEIYKSFRGRLLKTDIIAPQEDVL